MRPRYWLTILTPLTPLAAQVQIDDGTTHQIVSSVIAADDYETDGQATPGGGILEITSSGSLIFQEPRSILNTNAEGSLIIDGLLEQDASSPSQIFAPLTANSGGIVRSIRSSLRLNADSDFQTGSSIEASGGNIVLAQGTHSLNGLTLLGSSDLVLEDGLLVVKGAVNSVSGSATGGISLLGGTARDFLSILGGGALGTLSTDRATFGAASIGDPTSANLKLRVTGTATQLSGTTLQLFGGQITNEGTFNHQAGGTINTDSAPGAERGVLINQGDWTMHGDAAITNTNGAGRFFNHGLLQTADASTEALVTGFESESGSEIHTANGSTLTLLGDSTMNSGVTLSNDGDLILSFGDHNIWGADLSGSGFLQAGSFGNLGAALGRPTNVTLQMLVGPSSGPATGGFHLNGATMRSGGLGVGYLAAERGKFTEGTIAGPRFRFTGNSFKTPDSSVDVSSGWIENEGTFTQQPGGRFDLDPNDTTGVNGTLINRGTWNFLSQSGLDSSHGEGSFENHGTLRGNAPGSSSSISVLLTNKPSGIIEATTDSTLELLDGGFYEAGSSLLANGTIRMGDGWHNVLGSTIDGSGFLELGTDTTLSLIGDLGPATGPATGGFHLDGGTLDHNLLFASEGDLAVERGKFSSGTIVGPTVRLTGNSEKTPSSITKIIDATLINEGTFEQQRLGYFDLDPINGFGNSGTIVNKGTWNVTDSTGLTSSFGEGNFNNEGLFDVMPDITAVILSPFFTNEEGGVLRVGAGSSVYAPEGTFHHSSSTIDLAGGQFVANGGRHFFAGNSITGSGAVVAETGNMHVEVRVGPETGPATGGLSLNGGTLRGHWDTGLGGAADPTEGQISVDHGELRKGTINGAQLRYTGASSQPGAQTITILDGSLINDGIHTQQSGGNYQLDPISSDGLTGEIINNGEWLSTGTSSILSSYGGGNFRNTGTLTQGIGTLTIDSPISNDGGTIHAEQGIINLKGSSSFNAGSKLFADGEAIFFRDGTHQLYAGELTGNQYTYFSSGTVRVLGPVGAASGPATGRFGINGGTVNGTDTLSAATGWFHSGTISGDVTLRVTGDSLKPANSQLSMTGGTIRNDGSLVQESGGNINLDPTSTAGAGSIVNHGTWTSQGTTRLDNSYNNGAFYNSGTYTQESGSATIGAILYNQADGLVESLAGNTFLAGGGFHETGSTLRANGGSIYLNGGTHRFNGGSFDGPGYIYASAGTVQLAGNIGPLTGPASGGLGIVGGSISGTGMISVDRAYFSSGSVSGSVVIRVTGDLSQQDASTLAMSGGTLQNESPNIQTVTGDFNLDPTSGGSAGHLINNGIWALDRTVNYYNSYGAGIFENRGVFLSSAGTSSIYASFQQKPGSTLRVTGDYIYLRGGGTLEPGASIDNAGGDVYLQGGTHVLTGGTLSGPRFTYASNETTSIQGNVGALTGPATGGFGISGGTVTGTHTLSADHGYFSTGSMRGAPTLRFTGAITKPASTQLAMNGGTIINEGTFDGDIDSNFNLDDLSSEGSGTIINRGTWNLNAASIYSNSYQNGQFENEGLFHSHTGNSNLYPAFHHRNGSTFQVTGGSVLLRGGGSMEHGATIIADGGSLYFHGGTHTLTGGSFTGPSFSYASAGTTSILGDVGTLTGPATGGFGISGGTVTGTHTLSADHGYFSTGSMSGSATLRFTGAITKPTSTQLDMNGGTIINEGTFDGNIDSNFNLDSVSSAGAGTIINRGTWNLNAASTYSNSYQNGQFENEGYFVSKLGTSTIHAHFSNTGHLEIEAGTLYLRGGSNHQGLITANGGIVFHQSSSHRIESPAATLRGNSWIYGNVNIRDGAFVEPGNSIGSLHIGGTMSFTNPNSSPVLHLELATPDNSDTLALENTAVLNLGTNVTLLELSLLSLPTLGDTFRIVDAGTSSGSFSGTFANAPSSGDLVAGVSQGTIQQFEITYDPAGKFIELKAVGSDSPYDTWATNEGLTGTDADFNSDPDGDGLINGFEFLFGSDPQSASRLHDPTSVIDSDELVFSFRQTDEAAYLGPVVQSSPQLGDWHDIRDGAAGVTITTQADAFGPGVARVEVRIPRSLAKGGKLFARLVVR